MFKEAALMLAEAEAEAHSLNWERLRRDLMAAGAVPNSCKLVLKQVETVEGFRRCCARELRILKLHSSRQ